MSVDVEALLEDVRGAALALPETTERKSHSAPTFFVRKKTFVYFWDNHHDDGRVAVWASAPPGVQEEVLESEPDRFFRPPYVGHRGWIGYRLDQGPVDGDELAAVVADAYRTVAPKTLVALLDESEDAD
jgi:hypothetical protein